MWGTLEDDGPTIRDDKPPQIVKTRRRTPRSQQQPLPEGKTLHGYPFKPFPSDPPALTMKIPHPRASSSTLLALSGLLALLTVSALLAAIIAFAS